jgi:hypothetical protein
MDDSKPPGPLEEYEEIREQVRTDPTCVASLYHTEKR